MTPAETLRALRARAGHTQTYAGQCVGVRLRAWQQYEAGERRVPPAVLHLYALQVAALSTLTPDRRSLIDLRAAVGDVEAAVRQALPQQAG